MADLAALIILAAVVYFLPAFVAVVHDHHCAMAIAVLHLLLGWTLLGWIAAMVWACTKVQRTDPGPSGPSA